MGACRTNVEHAGFDEHEAAKRHHKHDGDGRSDQEVAKLLSTHGPLNAAGTISLSQRDDPLPKRRAPQSDLGTALRNEFARNVRHFRQLRGMTQHDLAIAAGLGRSFISQLESGRFSATLETVGALSAALGIAPAQLIRALD